MPLFFCSLNKDDKCNVQYEDLMAFLDFKTRPVFNLSETDYEKVVRHAPPLKNTEVCFADFWCFG